MADGGWIVLGTAIGVAGTLLTTWLNAKLTRDKLDAYDRAAIKILKEALEKGAKWQSIQSLAALIGASEDDTKGLLVVVGARSRMTQTSMWGLRSRNPYPDKLPLED